MPFVYAFKSQYEEIFNNINQELLILIPILSLNMSHTTYQSAVKSIYKFELHKFFGNVCCSFVYVILHDYINTDYAEKPINNHP